MRTPLRFALLALLVGSCQPPTSLLLRVSSEVHGVRSLKLRIVNTEGVLATTLAFPPDGSPTLELPATLELPLRDDTRWAGIVAWGLDAQSGTIASGISDRCMVVTANVQARYDFALVGASSEFSPDVAESCRCNAEDPRQPMCGPGAAARPGEGGAGGGLASGRGGAGMGGASGASGMSAAGMGAAGRPGGAGGAGGMSAMGGAGGGSAMGGAGGGSAMGGAGAMSAGGAGGMSAMGGAGGRGGQGGQGGMAAADAAAPSGDGSSGMVVSGSLFGFERADPDWTSMETMLKSDTTEKTEGMASLSFTPAAKTFVRSRAFATSETPGATAKLSLDVWVAEKQSFQSNIQIRFDCRPAVYDAYLGYKTLADLTPGKWNTLAFDVPGNAVAAFQGQNMGCKIWLEHNGSGLTRYDRMGFAN